jgi:hypothetical protein
MAAWLALASLHQSLQQHVTKFQNHRPLRCHEPIQNPDLDVRNAFLFPMRIKDSHHIDRQLRSRSIKKTLYPLLRQSPWIVIFAQKLLDLKFGYGLYFGIRHDDQECAERAGLMRKSFAAWCASQIGESNDIFDSEFDPAHMESGESNFFGYFLIERTRLPVPFSSIEAKIIQDSVAAALNQPALDLPPNLKGCGIDAEHALAPETISSIASENVRDVVIVTTARFAVNQAHALTAIGRICREN